MLYNRCCRRNITGRNYTWMRVIIGKKNKEQFTYEIIKRCSNELVEHLELSPEISVSDRIVQKICTLVSISIK